MGSWILRFTSMGLPHTGQETSNLLHCASCIDLHTSFRASFHSSIVSTCLPPVEKMLRIRRILAPEEALNVAVKDLRSSFIGDRRRDDVIRVAAVEYP